MVVECLLVTGYKTGGLANSKGDIQLGVQGLTGKNHTISLEWQTELRLGGFLVPSFSRLQSSNSSSSCLGDMRYLRM